MTHLKISSLSDLEGLSKKNQTVSLFNVGLSQLSDKEMKALFMKLKSVTTLNLSMGQLGRIDENALKNYFGSLKNIKNLNISSNDLGRGQWKSLSEPFKNNFTSLKELDVSSNYLKFFEYAKFRQFCFMLPKSLKKLSLANNLLNFFEDKHLISIFEQINQLHLRSLDLSCNFLGDKSPPVIKKIAANLSPKLKELNLSDNKFDEHHGADVASMLNKISSKLRILYFRKNGLGKKRASDIEKIFQAMNPKLKKLDLSQNDMHLIPGESIGSVYTKLPKSINELILSINLLGKMKLSDLKIMLSSLPIHLKKLDMSYNLFHEKGTELEEVIKLIPLFVTSINFSGNKLGQLSTEILKETMRSFPAKITYLNLSDNQLHLKGKDLKDILAAIPKTVKTLDLRGNGIEELPLSTLRKLKGKLHHIQTIILDGNILDQLKNDKKIAIEGMYTFSPKNKKKTKDIPSLRKKAILNSSGFFKEGEKVGNDNEPPPINKRKMKCSALRSSQ